mgnify:FL=1
MKNIVNNYSSIEQLTNQYLNKQKSTEKKINGMMKQKNGVMTDYANRRRLRNRH